MRISAETSCLLVVDIQDKLAPAIHESDQIIENAAWLIRIAREVDLPVRLTEQYPQGLGATVAQVRSQVVDEEVLEKVHFSCMDSDPIRRHLAAVGRRQIVVAGTEAHVCVLQSALGLVADGYEVFVVADAISSRKPRDVDVAIERMRDAGVRIVTREMVAFEWLNRADTELFRRVQQRFIR